MTMSNPMAPPKEQLKSTYGVKQPLKLRFSKLDVMIGMIIVLSTLGGMLFADSFHQRMIVEMMIFAILAMSLDLLVGYTGLLNLGHAIYFGMSGIIASVLFVNFSWPLLLSIAGAVVITMLLALPIALLNCKFNGIQFAMLSIAFGQLFWTISINSRELSGGHDGKVILESYNVRILDWIINFKDPTILLIITGIILLISYLLIKRITNSHYGKLLTGVKENQKRLEFLGFNTYRVKVQVYMIASLFSAVAGTLYFLLKAFVTSENMSWIKSGDILLMTLVGGSGTIFGPLFGATFFVWFKDWASSYTQNWMLVIGLVFIVVVLYFPKGVFGWMNDWQRRK